MTERLPASSDPAIDDATVRRWLEIQRARLAGLISGLEREGMAAESQADAMGEMAPASQHPADIASDTFERERDLGLLEDFRAELDEVSAALIRLSHGVYGICEGCRVTIPVERLEAVPATRYCIACEQRHERDVRFRTAAGVDRTAGGTARLMNEYLAHDDDAGRDDGGTRSAEEAAIHLMPPG
jgi:RNA polymerase-binding transcription factor DksA